ncbi:MAG: class I SAM-dependent methyltransferase [Eubacteriales bacterium]|nr:class I SAM-dependent methyltransferase [Eubacteriales bacterium]
MDRLKISKRLQTAAGLVIKGNIVADIGTDHGYLPIYLVKNGISPHVIAMDVRSGPLSKAENNIAEYGIKSEVELRLSDGLEKLNIDEAKTVTICGMGGKLMQQILGNGIDKLRDGMQLILSPQSEWAEFRIFLKNNNIHIVNELMIKEDNQYYVIMDCRYQFIAQSAKNRYGGILLERRDPVLKELLCRELELNGRLLEKLKDLRGSEAAAARFKALKKEEMVILEALKYYE